MELVDLVGHDVIDEDGAVCKVISATTDSINVWVGKKSDRENDASSWFEQDIFWERFKIICYELQRGF